MSLSEDNNQKLGLKAMGRESPYHDQGALHPGAQELSFCCHFSP